MLAFDLWHGEADKNINKHTVMRLLDKERLKLANNTVFSDIFLNNKEIIESFKQNDILFSK